MSWKRCTNSDNTKPAELDTTSSKAFVYVRKNFEEVPSLDENGEQTGTHWEFDETEIPKEDWAIYEAASTAQDTSEQNAADITYLAVMAGVEL